MKKINTDFTQLMTDEYVSQMAESHIECWKDRYSHKSKKSIRLDLDMNHDDSLEIEHVEEDLGRKLTDEEQTRLIKRFHSSVIKNIHNN